jgi:hypothetical protein
VLVALVTVLAHRSHTAALINQSRAADQWNLYESKKIRQTDTGLNADLLTVLGAGNSAVAAGAESKLAEYKAHQAKWDADLAAAGEQARLFEASSENAESRGDRLDLAEALLQISVVLASVTLLTRQNIYWYMGILLGAAGAACALSAIWLH